MFSSPEKTSVLSPHYFVSTAMTTSRVCRIGGLRVRIYRWTGKTLNITTCITSYLGIVRIITSYRTIPMPVNIRQWTRSTFGTAEKFLGLTEEEAKVYMAALELGFLSLTTAVSASRRRASMTRRFSSWTVPRNHSFFTCTILSPMIRINRRRSMNECSRQGATRRAGSTMAASCRSTICSTLTAPQSSSPTKI